MSPKEYLSQVILLDEKIEANLEMLERLKSRVFSVGSQIKTDTRVDGGYRRNFTDSIDRMVDVERDINNLIDEYVDLKNKITREINQMTNNTYSLILIKRYILNKPLIEIARETHYSYGTMRNMHGQALKDFERCVGRDNMLRSTSDDT